MKAYVLHEPGGPEALKLQDVPDPVPHEGQVHIKVRAFGLNRSEYHTRKGLSPSVKLPRVLGIECVGEVLNAPGTRFSPGDKVAAMMGGMGREYDGSYAEQLCVPQAHVFKVNTELDWARFGALPEMLQTAAGSLHTGLEIERASSILIRGGTSSIGMAAAVLAQKAGLTVASTTRSPAKAPLLKEIGVDHVIIDNGELCEPVRDIFPEGIDRVLELIGTPTLEDSLHATRSGGIVCMTGMLSDVWTFDQFAPMRSIPSGVKLTCYSGGSQDISEATLQGLVDDVHAGRAHFRIAKVFEFAQLVEAHRFMDESAGAGKLVVTVG